MVCYYKDMNKRNSFRETERKGTVITAALSKFTRIFAFLTIFALGIPSALCAQEAFLRGESLFLQNKPEDALAYLEAAVVAPEAPLAAFLYLAMAYQQVNRPDDAIAVYQKVLPTAGDSTALAAYSMGNVYYGKGDFAAAEAAYTQALDADAFYTSACLNRANTRLRLENLDGAFDDYTQYLALVSDTPQRAQIEAVLAALQKSRDEAAAAAQKKADEEIAAAILDLEREIKARDTIPAIVLAMQTMDAISAELKAADEETASALSEAEAAAETQPPADTLSEDPSVPSDTEATAETQSPSDTLMEEPDNLSEDPSAPPPAPDLPDTAENLPPQP